MMSRPVRYVVVGSVALFVIAGSSYASMHARAANAAIPRGHVHAQLRVPPGYRIAPGPAIAGPQLVRTQPPGPGFMLPGATSHRVLFVVDANNTKVLLYNPAKKNPSPEGMITAGLNCPAGAAVDKAGTLYIVNSCNNTVTEYLKGQTTVHFTINTGMNSPYGIGVDSHKRVFVSNLGNNTVTGYKPKSTSPYETISGVGPNPVGVAVDSKDNVYVADDSDNTIYLIPAGSNTAQNSGITQLNGPIGVSFDTGDTLYVANFALNQVAIYPSGSKTPTSTLTNGINEPTLNGFAKPGIFFQSDQTGPVVGFKPGQTTPFSTISGIGRPLGIVSYPRLKP